jgi:hypothetical protein
MGHKANVTRQPFGHHAPPSVSGVARIAVDRVGLVTAGLLFWRCVNRDGASGGFPVKSSLHETTAGRNPSSIGAARASGWPDGLQIAPQISTLPRCQRCALPAHPQPSPHSPPWLLWRPWFGHTKHGA